MGQGLTTLIYILQFCFKVNFGVLVFNEEDENLRVISTSHGAYKEHSKNVSLIFNT